MNAVAEHAAAWARRRAVRSCATCAHFDPATGRCAVTGRSVTARMLCAGWRPANRLATALAAFSLALAAYRLVVGPIAGVLALLAIIGAVK